MRKIFDKKLNQKGFTLVEIVMAIALVAVALVAIGAMLIGTQNSTGQMLSDSQIHKQSNIVKDALYNEFVTTNSGVKYWVKDHGSDVFVPTVTGSGDELEHVVAFYKIDASQSVLYKTYYVYNSQNKTLKRATVNCNIPTQSELETVDVNIKSVIGSITSWDVVSTDVELLRMDLSGCTSGGIVGVCITIKRGQSAYTVDNVINVRGKINVNGTLVSYDAVDSYNGLVIPPKPIGGLVADGDSKILIEAGYANGRAIYYKVGDNGSWSMSLPMETRAGTYRVYYYVDGDSYYTSDNLNSYVVATIGEGVDSVTWTKWNCSVTANSAYVKVSNHPLIGTTTTGETSNLTYKNGVLAAGLTFSGSSTSSFSASTGFTNDKGYNGVYNITYVAHQNEDISELHRVISIDEIKDVGASIYGSSDKVEYTEVKYTATIVECAVRSTFYNCVKGSSNLGEFVAADGALPEDGDLIIGGAGMGFCVLRIGDAYYYYTTSADNHTHGYSSEVLVGAGCTTYGVTKYSCECGNTKIEHDISPLTHDYREIYVGDQVMYYECRRCQDMYWPAD